MPALFARYHPQSYRMRARKTARDCETERALSACPFLLPPPLLLLTVM
jgi:hypothetical protein